MSIMKLSNSVYICGSSQVTILKNTPTCTCDGFGVVGSCEHISDVAKDFGLNLSMPKTFTPSLDKEIVYFQSVYRSWVKELKDEAAG